MIVPLIKRTKNGHLLFFFKSIKAFYLWKEQVIAKNKFANIDESIHSNTIAWTIKQPEIILDWSECTKNIYSPNHLPKKINGFKVHYPNTKIDLQIFRKCQNWMGNRWKNKKSKTKTKKQLLRIFQLMIAKIYCSYCLFTATPEAVTAASLLNLLCLPLLFLTLTAEVLDTGMFCLSVP